MKQINYITNLDLAHASGGWNGINSRLYGELTRHYEVCLVGPINPPISYKEKILSKALRVVGMRGNFFFYSDRRLSNIGTAIAENINHDSECNFFFGVTPWINYRDEKPYGLYLDASFLTYLNVYSTPGAFSRSDIQRICAKEARWLESAQWIFWGSNWSRDEAARNYGITLTPERNIVVNTGGNIPVPDSLRPEQSNQLTLLFISLDFERKGGRVCWQAFKFVRSHVPNAKLIIIGQQPPAEVTATPGVEYAGLLKKNNPRDLEKMISCFQSATFLVHPTRVDANPVVIIEAGYYGCPAIAPAAFGIPDQINDRVTGFLINEIKAEHIAHIIIQSHRNPESHEKMRRECYRFTTRHFSWENVGRKIANFMAGGMPADA